MKRFSIMLLVLFAAGLSYLPAQSKGLSVGLIGSVFGNEGSSHRISEIKNPAGTGLILGYQFNKDIAVGLTTEYYKQSMENFSGDEKGYRTHLSFIVFPYHWRQVGLYLSAGMVYSHREMDYASVQKNDEVFGRFGLGVDVQMLNNISLNVDGGFYNDGFNVKGWSNSVGFRYALPGLF